MARQSGRCHHPHIPVRSRGRAVVPRAAAPSSVFRKWYYTTEAARCGLYGAVRPCRAATIKFAQSRVSVDGVGWCVAPAGPRGTRAGDGTHATVCATPSREMCGANIGSRLLQRAGSSNHGTHSAVKRLSQHVVGLISAHATRYVYARTAKSTLYVHSREEDEDDPAAALIASRR